MQALSTSEPSSMSLRAGKRRKSSPHSMTVQMEAMLLMVLYSVKAPRVTLRLSVTGLMKIPAQLVIKPVEAPMTMEQPRTTTQP